MAHIQELKAVVDSIYTIGWEDSNMGTFNLAPLNGTPKEDDIVVTKAPNANEDYLWSLVKRGEVKPNGAIVTLEALDSQGNGTKSFLSYDYVTNSLVTKKSSQPGWVLTAKGTNKYQITLFTDPKQFLTFEDNGKPVSVTSEVAGKQIWVFTKSV